MFHSFTTNIPTEVYYDLHSKFSGVKKRLCFHEWVSFSKIKVSVHESPVPHISIVTKVMPI